MHAYALKAALSSAFAIAVFATVPALAAQEPQEIPVQGRIARVTVYADRAMVERDAKVDLAAGRQVILFDGLPDRTEAGSLQVKGSSGMVLEDVVFRTRAETAIPDERIKALDQKMKELMFELQGRRDSVSRYQAERQFIQKIVERVTSSGKEGAAPAELDPARWLSLLELQRSRLAAVDTSVRAEERDIQALNEELARLKEERSRLDAGRTKRKNVALVTLRAEKALKAALISLSYIVDGPSWSALYDIRVDSKTRAMTLSYNANVTQATGEDWNGVKLSLSTARPDIPGYQPELEPWFLSLYTPSSRRRDSSSGGSLMMKAEAAPAAPMAQMYDIELAEEALVEMGYAGAAVQSAGTAVLFAVEGLANIPADADPHKVGIAQAGFTGSFRHSTAPKLAARAYLKAKAKNDTAYPFLRGPSKVFLDGAFVADSVMEAVQPGEEFWTFLGADEGVKVEYKLVKKQREDTGAFNKNEKWVYQYETKVTNNRDYEVELVLWDQLPISSDEKISVKLIDPKYSKDTESLKKNSQNILEWLIPLKPGQSALQGFSFSVEYPQGSVIQGL